MKSQLILAVLVSGLVVLPHRAEAQPAADEVTSLPGVTGPLASKQYSGYLSASGTIKLHYWFVESERDPMNDPLVLWMNGGPGCSSLDGFLSELGPYETNPDGETLSKNNYTWAKVANVIFLESPAGVGFSYSADKNYTTNDDETSKNNYLALLDFFVKFPNMADNSFFITGESYGGVYVPMLSVRVMANLSINFQGFAIGNGLLDDDLNLQTAIYYAYYHGILGEDTWSNLQKYCCTNGTCQFANPLNEKCNAEVAGSVHYIYSSGINPYDITGDCAGGVNQENAPKEISPLLSYYFKSLKLHKKLKSSYFSDGNILACIDTGPETKYLNMTQVRQALHIPSFVPKWEVCNLDIGYRKQYSSMRDQFLSLLPKHRGLVYNGDADIECNFLGDQKFVASLGRKEKGGKRAWFSNNQVAGFVTEYDQVTFMTVKNAGHMVPSFSPGQSLQMISNFLDNKPQ